MESVKIAPGLGGHGSQLLYSSGRQPPPPGAQVIHPPTTRSHENSYKGTISPPMGSRAPPFPSYGPAVDGHGGAAPPRYIQQPYIAYRDSSPYSRPITDRPHLIPTSRRPTMMGYGHGKCWNSYGGTERKGSWVQNYPYMNYSREVMQILPTPMGAAVDSCKRMKLQQNIKTDVHCPIAIDTDTNHSSRESSYCPQVEAISPTPPDPREESPLDANESELKKKLDQIVNEISMVENSIESLTKKARDLQAAEQKGDSTSLQQEEEVKEPKYQSRDQVIYAENRKKAEESHNTLKKLIADSDMSGVLPLYHQPTDTEVYEENTKKHQSFKQHLLDYFKRKHTAKANREEQIMQTYSKMMSDWMKKVDKIENSKKHKEKVAKNRELFEKVFPELRKQREDKERFSRVGTRVKSEADMEEVMDGLLEQENEDKKMRAYAVIPPILLDEKRRKYRYINKNGLIEDPVAEYKEHKNINIWNEQESEIFKEKYLQHPKNFVIISGYLEKKSVTDCIQHYYLTKKKENYKALIKRRLRRPRTTKGHNPTLDSISMTNSSTGVTTRGSAAAQKEQLKSGPTPTSSSICSSGTTSIVDDSSSVSINGNCGVSCTAVVTTTDSIHWVRASPSSSSSTSQLSNRSAEAKEIDEGGGGAVVSSSSPVTSPTFTAATTSTVHSTVTVTGSSQVGEKDKENLSSLQCDKLRWVRKDEEKQMDSSDEENIAEHGRGGPHDCVVCKERLEHYGQSRPVAPSQASQYNLSESALGLNARVCTYCRCRSVRRRVTQGCPLPLCPTPKWKVKRLRPFPSKWNNLSAVQKEPILKELQITNDVTKSCSACHTRILRKLGGSEVEEPFDPSKWSEEDIQCLQKALREVGCRWSKISEKIPNKSASHCKSFYYNMKGKYNLEEVVAAYRESKGKSDPPTEEESSSSHSSSDETGLPPPPLNHPPPHTRHDSASDTASASSPAPSAATTEDQKEVAQRDAVIKEPKPPSLTISTSASGNITREDYDSSTTASADECQSGAGRDSPPEIQHIPHPGEKRLPTPTIPSNRIKRQGDDFMENYTHRFIEEAVFKMGRKTPDHTLKDKNIDMQLIMENIKKNDIRKSEEVAKNDGDIIDLRVNKRDRSPPQHIQHISQLVPPNPIGQRGESPFQVRVSSADGTVIEKPPQPPPLAHSNSVSYLSSPHGFDTRSVPSTTASHAVASIVSREPSPQYPYEIPTQSTRQTVNIPKSTKPSMIPPHSISLNSQRLSQISTLSQNSVTSRLPSKHEKTISLGSITHGTPVNQPHSSVSLSQSPRLEMIAKPAIPREGGSITQGTPVHHDNKRLSTAPQTLKSSVILEPRSSGVEIIPRTSHLPYDRESTYRSRPSNSMTAAYPFPGYPYHTRPYSDSQIISRQQVESDYITAKQMKHEKEIRVPPRGSRDPSPHGVSREHKTFHPPPTNVRNIETHGGRIDKKEYRLQQVDPRMDHHHQAVEFRPVDVRTVNDNDKLRGLQYIKTHGIPTHPPSSVQHYYAQSSDSRAHPSHSSASVREVTPTPLCAVSTSAPIPRHNSVIRRPTPKPTSSISPRPEPERYSPLPRYSLTPTISSSEPLHMIDNGSVISKWKEAKPGYVTLEGHHTENLNKKLCQSAEPVHSSRFIIQGAGPPDIRRHSDKNIYSYKDTLRLNTNKHQEGNEENEPGKMLNYEPSKPSPSPKNQPPKEIHTAGKFLEAIIKDEFPKFLMNESSQRMGRREGESPSSSSHTLHISEVDKRVHSPSFQHKKDKEIVTVDDGPEITSSHRPSSTQHSHHQSFPKSNPTHIDSVINRELATSNHLHHHHPLPQPPLEITRSVTLLNEQFSSKIRSANHPPLYSTEKDHAKDRFDSRSPHRLVTTAPVSNHIHSNPNIIGGERQIVRVQQPYDFITNRVKELCEKQDIENAERRCSDIGSRHSRSVTPQMQKMQVQQRPHPTHPSHLSQLPPGHHSQRGLNPYEDDHIKKRPRLDLPPEGSQRPMRSNGPDSKDPNRDDVADSPQSGEMVIDESPRISSADQVSLLKLPSDMSRPATSDSTRLPVSTLSQYSYPSYRVHTTSGALPPHSSGGSWVSIAGAPPITTSVCRFPNYEPNVEPVSDED